MRESGFTSTGPNLAKSTSGHGGTLNGSAPPPRATAGAPLPDESALFTNPCTSACRTRPLGPDPGTRDRSTPSSRANLRTDGLACGLVPVSSCGSRGTGRVAAGAGPAAAGFWGAAFWDAAAGAGAGAFAPDAARTRIGAPFDTLSPTLILSSFTTPALGDGISIVALSDSSVISDCSFATVSPGFTRTSITSTSLKSPISGTGTVAAAPCAPGAA